MSLFSQSSEYVSVLQMWRCGTLTIDDQLNYYLLPINRCQHRGYCCIGAALRRAAPIQHTYLLDDANSQKKIPLSTHTKSPAARMTPNVAPVPEELKFTTKLLSRLNPPTYFVS